MDESVDFLISALENETRREILRSLVSDGSYAFQISRSLGISQQAINKQLSFLENARLIIYSGIVPSESGAPRKIYRPTGFSTVIIDYSRNFLDTRKIPLEFPESTGREDEGRANGDLIHDLKAVNGELENLMEKRTSLIQKKDGILEALNRRMSSQVQDRFSRAILEKYLQYLDEGVVASKLSIPENVVRYVVENYF